MSKESNSGGGIGLCSAVFLVFLVLKLCSVITWSWWWVTAPLWIPTAFVVFVLLLIGIGTLALKLIE